MLESKKKPIQNQKFNKMNIVGDMLDSWTGKQQIGKCTLTVPIHHCWNYG